MQIEEEDVRENWPEIYATPEILDAKYEKDDLNKVVRNQTGLNHEQQEDLHRLFEQHKTSFDGIVGVYLHKTFHVDVEKGYKPKHLRPYAVPHIRLGAFNKELQHLVDPGVLKPKSTSEWALPTFIIPEKDSRVNWISNLRELNECIVQKEYPIPIINDILKKRKGYAFFGKFGISMQYYTF